MSTRCGVGTSALRPRRGHKERSKNFTELEKRTVLELIARHRDVLRQGRSNNATNRSKQLVWSTICEEVNKRCGGERPRTPAQVKMWYENYKKKCKMRAHETQPMPVTQVEAPSLLDGMLWQSLNPLDVKDEETDAATSVDGTCSVKDDDCEPVNMSNGGRQHDDDQNILEPQIQITHKPPLITPMEQVRLRNLQYLHKLKPLNLSAEVERNEAENRIVCEEEKMYYNAKRQHAVWEHEAKMKILNMELRQKEEIFSLQKQLFLVELKLKMDFLEKAANK